MKKLIVALIASVAAMSAAQAQQAAPRAYVGGALATADHDYKISGASNVNTSGYKTSGKLFGGYEFNQNWGVEAGYTDFRKSRVNYTANGVNNSGETKGNSIYLAAKATMPINEQVSVYGKLGAARNKNELEMLNASLNRDERKTEAYGALGAQYNVNQNVAVIAEYERYGKSKDFGAKADVWTVGAKYSF
jgi:OOP family OmpA-OmpF porin